MCCFPLLSPLTHSAAGFGLYSSLSSMLQSIFILLLQTEGTELQEEEMCTHLRVRDSRGWLPHRTRPKATLPTLMMMLHWPGLNEGATDVPSPPDKVIVNCWPWTHGTRVFLEKVVQQSSQECGLWSQPCGLNFSSITCMGKLLVLPEPVFSSVQWEYIKYWGIILSKWMDKENMMYIHSGVLFSFNKRREFCKMRQHGWTWRMLY